MILKVISSSKLFARCRVLLTNAYIGINDTIIKMDSKTGNILDFRNSFRYISSIVTYGQTRIFALGGRSKPSLVVTVETMNINN